MPMQTPLIVITRPLPQGDRFAEMVADAFGSSVDILVAPVMRIDPIPVNVDPTCDVIFSSANGVTALGQSGDGRVAFCVGDRTAHAAQKAGFETRIAGGSADHLIKLVLKSDASSPLVHVRGEHSRGDIATTLRAHGRTVGEVIAYQQSEIALSGDALSQICAAERAIFPIFSPRTAAILSKQLETREINCAVVALSDEIAAEVHFAKEIDVAPSISAQSVIISLERHIAA